MRSAPLRRPNIPGFDWAGFTARAGGPERGMWLADDAAGAGVRMVDVKSMNLVTVWEPHPIGQIQAFLKTFDFDMVFN